MDEPRPTRVTPELKTSELNVITFKILRMRRKFKTMGPHLCKCLKRVNQRQGVLVSKGNYF